MSQQRYCPTSLDELLFTEEEIFSIRCALSQHRNIMVVGDNCSGKSTFLSLCVKEYFPDGFDTNDILYLDPLQENNSQSIRTKIKTFVDSVNVNNKRHKMLVIDDISDLSDTCKHIIANTYDIYHRKLIILCSTRDVFSVCDSLVDRMLKVTLRLPDYRHLSHSAKRILEYEKKQYNEDIIQTLVDMSFPTYSVLYNNIKKCMLYEACNETLTTEDVENICCSIPRRHFFKFVHNCFNNCTRDAIVFLTKLGSDGYDIIDILGELHDFIISPSYNSYSTEELCQLGYIEKRYQLLKEIRDFSILIENMNVSPKVIYNNLVMQIIHSIKE